MLTGTSFDSDFALLPKKLCDATLQECEVNTTEAATQHHGTTKDSALLTGVNHRPKEQLQEYGQPGHVHTDCILDSSGEFAWDEMA